MVQIQDAHILMSKMRHYKLKTQKVINKRLIKTYTSQHAIFSSNKFALHPLNLRDVIDNIFDDFPRKCILSLMQCFKKCIFHTLDKIKSR